jgi:hypothetical protein
MPVDPHTGAAAEVPIGEYTLLSLASSIAQPKRNENALQRFRHIVWTIRYAFICGMQKGVEDANRELAKVSRPTEDALRAQVDKARIDRHAERKGQVSHG